MRGFMAGKCFWEVKDVSIRSFCSFVQFHIQNPQSLSILDPQPSHIPLPIPSHPITTPPPKPQSLVLPHLLATAQAPISRFVAGPEVGEMSKSKISIGKPKVMHAFGI